MERIYSRFVKTGSASYNGQRIRWKTKGIVYTKDNLSFAGRKINLELSYGNLQVVLGIYEQENQNFTKGMDFHNYNRTSLFDNVAADDSILRASDTESLSEGHNDVEVDNNMSSQSNGVVDADIELILQSHHPVSRGGGDGSSDHDKKKKRDIDNYGPYKKGEDNGKMQITEE